MSVWRWAALAVGTLAVASASLRLSDPWGPGHDGSSGAHYALAARSYVRHGLQDTRLACVLSGGNADPREWVRYVSQPPALPLLVAASFAVFGASESAARAVPLALTAGFLLALYLLTLRHAGERTAFFTLVVVASSPVLLVFGVQVSQEPLVLLLWTLFLGAYLRPTSDDGARGSARAVLLFAAAAVSGWVGVFLLAAVGIHEWRTRAAGRPRLVAALAVAGAAALASHLVWVTFSAGSAGRELLAVRFRYRTGLASGAGLDVLHFAALELWRATYLLTPAAVALTIIFLVRRRDENRLAAFVVPGLVGAGLLPMLAFSNWYRNHNYLLIYVLPFVGIAAGFALENLHATRRGGRQAAAALGALMVALGGATAMRLASWDADYGGGPPATVSMRASAAGLLRQHTADTDTILTNMPWWPQLMWSADRNLWFRAPPAAAPPDAARYILLDPREAVPPAIAAVLAASREVARDSFGFRLYLVSR